MPERLACNVYEEWELKYWAKAPLNFLSGNNFTTTSGDGTARLWELKNIPGGAAFLGPSAK